MYRIIDKVVNNRLLFLGDVFPSCCFPQKINHDIPYIFNLEAPLTETGLPIEGKINLRSKRTYLESMFKPMPKAVSIANNHTLDFGDKGFEDTLSALRDMGIGYFGAGTKEDNYNNPLIISIDNVKIALFGYCYESFYQDTPKTNEMKYGPAPLDVDIIEKDIKQVKGSVDIIVVELHWGTLYSNYPSKNDVIIARHLADKGVDLIIGHHAHTIQPIELYNNSIIAYGLGNYIFPDLNLPSYYDNKGIPTRRKIQKQRTWSKTSVGLLFDIKTKKYDIEYYYSDKHKVLSKKRYFHKYIFYKVPENLDDLQPLIEKNLRIKRVVRLLFSFIENPRMPSRKFWQSLINSEERIS